MSITFKCGTCDFTSLAKWNVKRHSLVKHGIQAKSPQAQQQEHQVLQTQQQYHHEQVHQAPHHDQQHQDDQNGDGVGMGLDKQGINIPNDLLLQACTKPCLKVIHQLCI